MARHRHEVASYLLRPLMQEWIRAMRPTREGRHQGWTTYAQGLIERTLEAEYAQTGYIRNHP